jgi:RHS repeat-associated protein
MKHLLGETTNWTRDTTYEDSSNRLVTTTESSGTVSYQHDDRGNIVFFPHLYNDGAGPPPSANVTPDFRDQMRHSQLNANDEVFYFYDLGGQRARKVAKLGANVEDRRYVAGWEAWRKSVSGTLNEERSTLHVMDGQRRISMIETLLVDGGSAVGTPSPIERFQLDNHLGTSVLELTIAGAIISYEEYHPYGSCAWWSGDSAVDVSRRRYRYTGMERDDETGLQYHSARYYAAWLGRWTGSSPSRAIDSCPYARVVGATARSAPGGAGRQ